jgi:hypothetical protein
MMNALGEVKIDQTVGGIVTRERSTQHIAALIYNYPPEVKVSLPVAKTLAEVDAVDATGVARRLELHIDHLPPSVASQIEILDRDHGNAIATWEKMRKPDSPT